MNKRLKKAIILILVLSLMLTGWRYQTVKAETQDGISADAYNELYQVLDDNIVQAMVYLCDSYDIKSEPDSKSGSVVTVYSGKTVIITDVTITDAAVWYKVKAAVNDMEYEGYIERSYLSFSNEALIEWEKKYIGWVYFDKYSDGTYADIEQFPESYKKYLYELKAAHPNWNFVMFHTNLDWNTVVANEMVSGRSLVPSGSSDAWKIGRYDNNWSIASQKAVEYYLDPRNYLNESYIFAMEQLTYNPSYHNLNGVQNIVNGTFMSGEIPNEGMTYAEAFFNTGSSIGVSPYHLASRVKQEQGSSGTSPLISGTYPGFEGLYNYFNIDASGETDVEIYVSGLTYARNAGWVTRLLAIEGGSRIIANSYILKGQDTPYLQKFDVDDSYYGLYSHQYMQNLAAPMSEAYTMKKAYTKSGSIDNMFSFKIPVYNNMPAETCSIPMEDIQGKRVIEDGIYNIITVLDETKSIEVENSSSVSGANVQLSDYQKKASQQWKISYNAAGYYVILNNQSGMALTVHNSGAENFANVEQKEYTGSTSQQWVIEDLGNGLYSFVSKCNGRYLDVESYSVQNGTNLQIYQKDGTRTQQFKLNKVGSLSGLLMGADGIWRYYKEGSVDYSFTGMAQNEYGWWYIRNGVLDWNYTGMAENEYGWWYYQNGMLDWNYTGMACNEYGWWYYQNGMLDWNYTGMAENEYGWWYYQNGMLDWNYTGMACNEYGWWYYQNGMLDWNYTGMACNEYGWWYYQNGMLDWNYTGWAENEYGWWHFTNGFIDYN